jgi:hypothetical protein
VFAQRRGEPLSPEMVKAVKAATGVDEPAIPTFLQRQKEGEAKDAARRAEIEQSNAQRKRTKAAVQKEKREAKAHGDTRKMPLVGRAALAHIRVAGTSTP